MMNNGNNLTSGLWYKFGLIFLVGVVLGWSTPSEAKSYRSSYKSSYKPRYKQPRTVIHKKTTIINRTTNTSGNNGGMGIMGTMAATAGGVVAGNAISGLFEDKPVQQAIEQVQQPIQQAVQQVVPDLTCPEGFVCKFANGAWQLTPMQK